VDSVGRLVITPLGHRKLLGDLQALATERTAIVRDIEEARSLGDLSENAQYDIAKRAQALNAAKYSELQAMLAGAIVFDPKTAPKSGAIGFGATVILHNEQNDEEVEYTVVGAYESDIDNGLLSVESPLARALLGKRVGDTVELRLPKGDRTYTILGVEMREDAIS
jgi:transcription elongation factor GreA